MTEEKTAQKKPEKVVATVRTKWDGRKYATEIVEEKTPQPKQIDKAALRKKRKQERKRRRKNR